MPPDQRSHDPARAGLSPAQHGFWELDLRSLMLALSDTARAICGIGPATCSLDDFLQLAHPDDLQRVRGKVHAAVRAGTRLDVGFRIVRNAGDERHVRAR